MREDDDRNYQLNAHDALIIVDVQNDFLPGGALAVRHGDAVIEPLNQMIEWFKAKDCPIIATRDWHPQDHCSFKAQGGPWPVHCVAESKGAQFPKELRLPKTAWIISKATAPSPDAYSGFQGTDLAERLKAHKIKRVWVGGLATDYCVRQTVLDALKAGLDAMLLFEAVRAVNLKPGDGNQAIDEMEEAGAICVTLAEVAP